VRLLERSRGPVHTRMRWVVVAAAAIACHSKPEPIKAPDVASRFDDVDTSVDPCEDFYSYACNTWNAATLLGSGEEVFERSFSTAGRASDEYSYSLLEQARKSPGDPLLDQVGTFYASCMDEDAIERAGTTPFAPLLTSIDEVHDPASLATALAELQRAAANPLFGFGDVISDVDAKRTIWGLAGTGTGLYGETYRALDDTAKKQLAAYESRITSVLANLGHHDAKVEAHAIVELETRLATLYLDPATARLTRRHAEVGRSGLAAALPHFDWDTFLAARGIDDVGAVKIISPKYLSELDTLLVSTPASTWRAHLAFHLVDDYQDALPRRFRDPDHNTPRRDYCTASTWRRLYDVMGQLYVRDRFEAKRERDAMSLARTIAGAMKSELANASWLDPQTRDEAERKLTSISWLVGAPQHWKRYDVPLDRSSYASNLLALTRLQVSRQDATIGGRTSREQRQYAVAVSNAQYVQGRNAIEMPPGVLQPPLFDPDAPVAVNYGAIGMVMAHELTHGFDDQGALYDSEGSQRDWWQPSTYAAFRSRTQCVRDQYSRYQYMASHVSGDLTVGEDIADIGGLKLAFAAYRSVAQTEPRVRPWGLTDDQQFFLSFAQTFCRKATLGWYRSTLATDTHAPSQIRVNGAVSAMPEFAAAFRCPSGARLAPAERCSVW
jgi:putative endopeptidase